MNEGRKERKRKQLEANPNFDKEYYAANKERLNEQSMLRKYGLDKAAYDKMVLEQNSACYICGAVSQLHIDHHHITNKVRKLLCSDCNTAIGQFQESPVLMNQAKLYLENHQTT